jgi:hypothetical protein
MTDFLIYRKDFHGKESYDHDTQHDTRLLLLMSPATNASSPRPPPKLSIPKGHDGSCCCPQSTPSKVDYLHKPIPFRSRTWQNINHPLPSLVNIPEDPPVHWRHRPFKVWNKKLFAYHIECWIPGVYMEQLVIEDNLL